MFKKLLASFLLGLYLLIAFPISSAKAQWYNQSFPQFYTQVYGPSSPPDEIFGERYTAAQTSWVLYSILAHMINQTAIFFFDGDTEAALTFTTALITGDIDINTGSSDLSEPVAQLPKVAPLYQQLFFTDRPLSGITMVRTKLRNFHIIPEANAQTTGFGFNALQPAQGLWRATRDMSYSLFVLASIALAFMIMFRVQISPRVVVTIQSAIPKIAITLILVTFSYAIAGFLIDLMYVVIGLISLFISQASTESVSPGTIFSYMTTGAETTGILGIFLAIGIYYLFSFFAFFIGGIGGADATGLALGLVSIILFLVFIITAIFIFIKVLWAIIKAFAITLLLVIIAPLQITAGLIFPGMGFSTWIKSFITNLAIFPIISLMLFLSIIFVHAARDGFLLHNPRLEGIASSGNGITSSLAVPHAAFPVDVEGYTSTTVQGWPPLFNVGDTGVYLIFLIMSYILLAMASKAPEIVKGFMSGRGMDFGRAFGETTAPAVGAGRAGADWGLSFGEKRASSSPGGATTWQRAKYNAARSATGTKSTFR